MVGVPLYVCCMEGRGEGLVGSMIKKARTYVKTVPRSVPTTASSSAATTEAVATRTTAAAREYLMNIKVRKGRERRRRGRVS